MSIKFKTSPQGIKITTYQPTNIKFEYENKLYRIEIYIEEPAENTKVKGDKEKKYKPEEKLKKAPYGALYLVKMELLHILQSLRILQRQ